MTRPGLGSPLAAFALSLAAPCLALLMTAAAPAFAQDASYRTPPAPVGDILNAPRLPRGGPEVSPDGARMVVPVLPSLVSIASLAEPVEKLAGLEILPGLRANRSSIKTAATGFSIVTTASGAKVRAQLPAEARIVRTAWSNVRAGLASDGAYNRTLTPFTFQAEERSLWQARETVLDYWTRAIEWFDRYVKNAAPGGSPASASGSAVR